MGREEQGHEDDKRIVFRHGGGRHRRAFGHLTSPAVCPTKPRKQSASATTTSAVVTSAQGLEAGVWVIAETTNLPTKFAKIVVTDEQGRYVMPDLPKAHYSGYGLVDSPKVQTAPGKLLNLTAVPAPHEAAAVRSTIRRSTGMRCSRSRPRASSPAPGRKATACPQA